VIFVTRDILADDLTAYGEDELAQRVLTIGDEDLRRIWERAGYYATADEHASPSGNGMILAKACALAAVEILEGASRDLRRKRRQLKGIG
jgi:hypothetical protein